MKAIVLLGTLKKHEQSNTEILCQYLVEQFKTQNVECEIIKLVNYKILAGTYSNMGEGDEWPLILQKIIEAEIVIFATPVWWNNQSSEIQRVIERLDAVHDDIIDGKGSLLDGKTGGIVITGDSDGAQHIISNISNFFNAVGIILPPYSTLSILWEGHKKGKIKPQKELINKYKKDYSSTVDEMVNQIKKFAES